MLGGVHRRPGAAELISVLAVAVTAGLKVGDIVDSLLVHPSLSESLCRRGGVVPARNLGHTGPDTQCLGRQP